MLGASANTDLKVTVGEVHLVGQLVRQGMHLVGRVRINRHYQRLHNIFVHFAATAIRTTMSSGTVLNGNEIMSRWSV